MKQLYFLTALYAAQIAFCAQTAEMYPVSDNVRGHENTEWSQSYAYHLTDAKKDLPRVLLVGDSVCSAYAGGVGKILDGHHSLVGHGGVHGNAGSHGGRRPLGPLSVF